MRRDKFFLLGFEEEAGRALQAHNGVCGGVLLRALMSGSRLRQRESSPHEIISAEAA